MSQARIEIIDENGSGGLRPVRLPVRLWAEFSSAGDTRLRGALKRTQLDEGAANSET